MLPNSKLTPSQIWPLATPAAITQRSKLLASHPLQFPYFWNIYLHNAATRNQEICAARCSEVSCDLPCTANCPSAAVGYEAYLLFQLMGNVKGGPLQGGFQALKCKSNIK